MGDVRVPAACCGILGFRASHGAVSMAGVIPVASSCDAIGEHLYDSYISHLQSSSSILLIWLLR